MRLENYTVEVRDPVLGYWDEVHVVFPFRETTKRHTSKLFSTKVNEGIVYKPMTAKARRQCREFAMLWAFELYSGEAENVRVRKRKVFQDGDSYPETVWENGEWEDC